MAEAEAGLELPIGLTEQKFLQQLARIEARAIKSARTAEQAFVKSNSGIARSTSGMSNQVRGQLQNVSFQLQDVIVQIQGGTSASRALAQQLPQLLGGFGALGSALGLVAGLAIPLAAQFINLGDGADDLKTATEAAEKALEAYSDAMGNTGLSAQDLAAKYGEAAGAARELLSVLAQTAETKALLAQNAAMEALQERFGDLSASVSQYRMQVDDVSRENWAIDIAEQFGLAIDQAERMADILSEINSTSDQNERNSLMVEMVGILNDAASAGGDINVELVNAAEEAARTGMAVLQIGAAADGIGGKVDNLATKMKNLAAQANSVAAAMSSAGVFIGSDGTVQIGARGRDPSTNWRFEDPEKDYDTLAERRAREAEQKNREAARSVGGVGRGASNAVNPPDIFEGAARNLTELERQIELVGKSAEETAKLRAQWEMLDAAKKAGIQVNDTLTAQINSQAEQVGQLTAELERAQIAQEQFDQAIDGIADSFAGALIAGESLRDGLAQVFKQIAADIINSGIRNALMGQFGGGGGFLGGLAQSIFGGGDRLTGALRAAGLPARASGGPVHAGQMYLTGENGPEPFVPAVNGRILSVAQAQAALRGRASGGLNATFAPNISIAPGVTQAELGMTMAAARQEYERNFLPMLQKHMPSYNERYS